MKQGTEEQVREHVRKTYAQVAQEGTGCGCGCGTAEETSLGLGYNKEDLSAIPAGANMGLGCGNPGAIADLKEGEFVLDLGSGGGFDCFLAGEKVGPQGLVIGVDMTPEMIQKARTNQAKSPLENVEFRLGEIENLPVADNSMDVILSNCVINLALDKKQVYGEAFRVLKPGGRLAISDIVTRAELPREIQQDLALHSGCMAGAMFIEDLRKTLEEIGFQEIRITQGKNSDLILEQWSPARRLEEYLVSAEIQAIRPIFRQ